MPSLDEYYRYIEKQEKSAASPGTANGTIKPPPPPPPPPVAPATAGNGRGGSSSAKAAPPREPRVRYVLKNGVTVPHIEDEELATVRKPSAIEPESVPVDHDAVNAEVEAGTERPVSLAETAMWQRLPHHLQTLARLTDGDETTQEEVARKYYSRGFKESRRHLIERLLDPTLTLEETARVLGVCPATVRRYTNRGVLPHHRTVGQQRRFRLSDVLAFLEAQDSGKKRASTLLPAA